MKQAQVRDWNTEIEGWTDKSPLKMWRNKTNTSLYKAAVVFDVSVTTIVQWEGGLQFPNAVAQERIERAIPGLLGPWRAWYAQKPTV